MDGEREEEGGKEKNLRSFLFLESEKKKENVCLQTIITNEKMVRSTNRKRGKKNNNNNHSLSL